MNQCYVNYPNIPCPDQEILGEGTKRIQVRIDESPFFIVRSHTNTSKEDRVFPLPQKPQASPNWRYAITLPGGYKNERGLVFVLGDFWGFWSFETESQRVWRQNESIPNKHFLMAALETDPTPFDKFCKELLLAEKVFNKESTQPVPRSHWTHKLHTHWFEILMETNCSSNKDSLESEHRILRTLKMDENSTKRLIEKLRRGAIVSMALRAINELPNAVKIIEKATNRTPKDNTWMSLLDLVKFEDSL